MALIASLSIVTAFSKRKYCTPSNSTCWPNQNDIDALTQALDPSASRILSWNNKTSAARISAVPLGSSDEQPLFGLGVSGLKPLYVRGEDEKNQTCFLPSYYPFYSDFCMASTRNLPYEEWMPAFVAWPVTTAQVQASLRFALDHNLCVMIAGTGHDFLNRHSCEDGIFIRLSLLKNIEWDLKDTKGFGHKDGNVKFGAGIVFDEAHLSASQNTRVVSSGWASTVGVVGWAIGGGHGPLAPSLGLGVDNILEVDIITAEGNFIVANAVNNTDLFWAIRGGGGGNWGIITAITYRAHQIPAGGFTYVTYVWNGTYCNESKANLDLLVAHYMNWSLSLDKNWGGLAFITPTSSENETDCGATWRIDVAYAYLGGTIDEAFKDVTGNLTSKVPPVDKTITSYSNWHRKVGTQPLEVIFPWNLGQPSNITVGGLPSVFISRDTVESGQMTQFVLKRLNDCPIQKTQAACNPHQIYNDITGNLGSPQSPNVSISESFRTAIYHYVATYQTPELLQELYTLGNHSYFSESAYALGAEDFETRYWGKNKQRLRDIKKAQDPSRLFSCHNCIGVDLYQSDDSSAIPTHYLIAIFGSLGLILLSIGLVCIVRCCKHQKLEKELRSTRWNSSVATDNAGLLGTNKQQPNMVL